MLNLILLHANRGKFEEAEKKKQIVEKLLAPIYRAKTDAVVSMPIPEKSDGDIVLGTVFQGDRFFSEFKMPLIDLSRHVGIFASAGHGKTTVLINLLTQLIDHKINFLAFDFKQDFRHLKDLPIICLRWNWLRLNPFVAPEKIDDTQWFNLVCNIFAHVFSWFFGSQYYLLEFVNAEYQEVRSEGYVHVDKVRQAIESTAEKSYKRDEYRNVVLNRLTTVSQVLHEVLDCEQGIEIEKLLDYPVVIELDGLDEGIANFLVNLFLVYILEYRRSMQHRGELKHIIIFDEAHRVFYKASELRQVDIELGPSPTQQLPRVIRDYDEGLIFLSQEPSKINDSAMANTDLKLVGYLGSGFDIEAVQHIYHLEWDDAEIIKKLSRAQWMAQKSGIPDPFLLTTKDYKFTKDVTDELLKERMKEFLATMQGEPKKPAGTMLEYVQLPSLTNNAQTILKHVGENPIRSVFNRYRELNVHPKEGAMAVKELQEKKFVIMHSIQQSPGRPSGYLEPTQLGKMWLSKNNVNLTAWDDYVGHVGLEHRVFQSNIAAVLKKLGYSVKKEHPLGDKRFDIYAEHLVQASGYKMDGSVEWKVDKRIGIEICVSSRTDFLAAQKTVSQLDEIIYVAKDQNIMMQMQREFVALGINEPKFKFILGHRYLTELHEQLSEKEGKMVAEA